MIRKMLVIAITLVALAAAPAAAQYTTDGGVRGAGQDNGGNVAGAGTGTGSASGSGSGGGLANTGTDPMRSLAVGVVLITAGGLLLATRRRPHLTGRPHEEPPALL